MINRKKLVPVFLKFIKCLINLSVCLIVRKKLMGRLFVDYAVRRKLFVLRVFNITKHEYIRLFFAGFKR